MKSELSAIVFDHQLKLVVSQKPKSSLIDQTPIFQFFDAENHLAKGASINFVEFACCCFLTTNEIAKYVVNILDGCGFPSDRLYFDLVNCSSMHQINQVLKQHLNITFADDGLRAISPIGVHLKDYFDSASEREGLLELEEIDLQLAESLGPTRLFGYYHFKRHLKGLSHLERGVGEKRQPIRLDRSFAEPFLFDQLIENLFKHPFVQLLDRQEIQAVIAKTGIHSCISFINSKIERFDYPLECVFNDQIS